MTMEKRPLRPIVQLLISIAIIALAVTATLVIFRYPEKFGPFVVGALVVTLASFLLLLLLRHFMVV